MGAEKLRVGEKFSSMQDPYLEAAAKTQELSPSYLEINYLLAN